MWLPWRRLVARTVDQLLLVFSIASVPGAEVLGFLDIWISYLIMIPIETILLATLGTTPGKFLCGLKVVQAENHQPLTFKIAIRRSAWSWFAGQAAGIGGAQIITGLLAWDHLKKYGATIWDRKASTTVIPTFLP